MTKSDKIFAKATSCSYRSTRPLNGLEGQMSETITQKDLKPILEHHQGNSIFAQILDNIENKEDLLNVLARYIYFSSPFGGAVANLAGAIAVRQDLFRDPNDLCEITADRSVEVTSKVFLRRLMNLMIESLHTWILIAHWLKPRSKELASFLAIIQRRSMALCESTKPHVIP